MRASPIRSLSARFDEEIRVLKSWLGSPRTIGTVCPTSQVTANRMASLINPEAGLPVLELGPGTGPITRAILRRGVAPQDLYSVEYTASLLPGLRQSYPGVNFIQGDAFDLDTALGDDRDLKFDCVVSALPLLNFPKPMRVKLITDLLDRMPAGRPVVQFTYGPHSPIPADWQTYTVEPLDWIMRNLPPARIWVYRRIAKS
ncbi:MAG: methyltransferase domain-containing protein [Nitratireductor sp.]|nr:methyltransferase domain-containing protein [Nitratireductor sp.]